MGYATGKFALGICDRCGFQTKLNKMRYQPVDGRMTRLKVCGSCLDIDNEQWQVRLLDLTDNQALRDPRPNNEIDLVLGLLWGTRAPITWGANASLTWGS